MTTLRELMAQGLLAQPKSNTLGGLLAQPKPQTTLLGGALQSPNTLVAQNNAGGGIEQQLNLSPQERMIVDYHRNTLKQGTIGRDENGYPITVYSTGVQVPQGKYKGKFVSVPGWVNGQILDEEQAYRHWMDQIEQGIWPIYDSGDLLNKRSREIHRIMDAEAP